MARKVQVECPSCGGPLSITRRDRFAVCPHCRAQSRIERVEETPTSAPLPGTLRVAASEFRVGVGVALKLAAALCAMVFLGLLGDWVVYEATLARRESQAQWALHLNPVTPEFAWLSQVVVTSAGVTVIADETGRLLLVGPEGDVSGKLDVGARVRRAKLGGLAADLEGGVYLTLTGALFHLRGPALSGQGLVGPLPAQESDRRLGALSVDPQGQLWAVTFDTAELVRVAPDGSFAVVRALDTKRFELKDERWLSLHGFIALGQERFIVDAPQLSNGFRLYVGASGAGTALGARLLGEDAFASHATRLADGSVLVSVEGGFVRWEAGELREVPLRARSDRSTATLGAAPDGGFVSLEDGWLQRYRAEVLR